MSTENTQDNKSFKGFWGTVKSAFKELADAKKKKAQEKISATKEAVKEGMTNGYNAVSGAVRNEARQVKDDVLAVGSAVKEGYGATKKAVINVSTQAASTMKEGAKKTLVATGRVVAFGVAAPRLVAAAAVRGGQKVAKVATEKAAALKQSAKRTSLHTAWNVRNIGRNVSKWISAKKEAAQIKREQTQNRAKAAIRLTRMKAKNASKEAAAAVKVGAQKTLVAAGKVVAAGVAAPGLVAAAAVYGGQKVAKVTTEKAAALKQSAKKTSLHTAWNVRNISRNVSKWFGAKKEAVTGAVKEGYGAVKDGVVKGYNATTGAVKDTYNASKDKAAQFMTGAKQTIAGSQLVQSAKANGEKIAGLVKAGYEQESHKQAVLNRALSMKTARSV